MIPTFEEAQAAWAEEAEHKPRTEATLEAMLHHTDDPILHKLAAQYRRGLVTAAEVEMKIRERVATINNNKENQ